MLLTSVSRAQWVGAWVAAVIVMMACSVIAGAHLTLGASELWLVVGVVPPGVLLLLWHGARPVTIAELLYSVNRQSKDGRR
jgi:hypothetical protein